uniref:Uncharacterized protein n=1 Tax=Rhizophora mucronata TaxID=61149 RepID=A0A2P2PHD0_RHIMU
MKELNFCLQEAIKPTELCLNLSSENHAKG